MKLKDISKINISIDTDLVKAEDYLKNHQLTWDEISKASKISKSTLTKLKSDSLKRSRWEVVHALAILHDKEAIVNELGTKPDVAIKLLSRVLDNKLGNTELDKKIKERLLEDPSTIIELIREINKGSVKK